VLDLLAPLLGLRQLAGLCGGRPHRHVVLVRRLHVRVLHRVHRRVRLSVQVAVRPRLLPSVRLHAAPHKGAPAYVREPRLLLVHETGVLLGRRSQEVRVKPIICRQLLLTEWGFLSRWHVETFIRPPRLTIGQHIISPVVRQGWRDIRLN